MNFSPHILSTQNSPNSDLGQIHRSWLIAGAIVIWVIGTASDGEPLPNRIIVLHPKLGVVEADVIDAIALLLIWVL